jgi:hypothetical protein
VVPRELQSHELLEAAIDLHVAPVAIEQPGVELLEVPVQQRRMVGQHLQVRDVDASFLEFGGQGLEVVRQVRARNGSERWVRHGCSRRADNEALGDRGGYLSRFARSCQRGAQAAGGSTNDWLAHLS